MSAMAEPEDESVEPDRLDIAPRREPDDADGVTVPGAVGEPLISTPEAAGRAARSGRFAIDFAVSIGLHAAVVAFFLIGPGRHLNSVLLSGLKHAGVSANGDAKVDSRRGAKSAPQPNVVSVVLTPPPASKRKIQSAPPPPAVAPVPMIRPAPARQARPARPAPPPPRQQIVAADAPANSTAEKVSRPPEPPVPKPPVAKQSAPSSSPRHPTTGKATTTTAEAVHPSTKPEPPSPPTRQPVKPMPPAPAKPVPTPQQPKEYALAIQQPFLMPGNGSLDGSGGTLTTSRNTGGESSNSTGTAKKGAGNAATSNYEGEVTRKLYRAQEHVQWNDAALHGEIHVQILIDHSGKVIRMRVLDVPVSSPLARAAAETIRRASPFPPFPAKIDDKPWPFSFTLAFNRLR